jgi:hypothetical protein
MRTGTFFASAIPPADRASENASMHTATDPHAGERNPLRAGILFNVTLGCLSTLSPSENPPHPKAPR